MRVAVAQMNPHVGDLAANGRKICARIAEATQAGCDVVVFPELALTGYPPEDLVFKSGFVDDVRRALDDVARTSPTASQSSGSSMPLRPIGSPRHRRVPDPRTSPMPPRCAAMDVSRRCTTR